MKKFLLALIVLAAACMEALAVPAINTPIRRTLPDGSEITFRIYGDEYFSYKTTSDGYNIVEGNDGFFYYAELAGSTLKRTATRAKDPEKRSTADRTALRSIAKGVPQSIASAAMARARQNTQEIQPNKVGEMNNRLGRLKTLVILVSFSDNDFTVSDPHGSFTNLLNEDGYSRNGSTGSAWNYYYDNSTGRFDPEFVVVGPYKLNKTMAYYGAHKDTSSDSWAAQMAAEACALADADVDFSEFANPDGVIRDVFVFYAGVNEAEGGPENTIWPHRWRIYQGSNVPLSTKIVFDGMKLQYYACSSELRGATASLNNPDGMMANIGTFCHEFGHVLGWCDYYNTSSEDNNTVNLGSLSLMNNGNYLNNSRTPPSISSFDRYLVGWLTPETIVSSGTYSLGTLSSSNNAYRIDTNTADEYFFIENRDCNYKWDKYMTGEYNNTPASADGIIIYHVDRSEQYIDRWYSNGPNTFSTHECMKVVRPDGSSRSVKNWFFNGSNMPTISSSTVAEYVCWSGISNGFTLADMSFAADKTMTFTVTAERKGLLKGNVTTMGGTPISGAQISLYKARDSQAAGPLHSIRRAETTESYTTVSAADGSYSFDSIEVGIYEFAAVQTNYNEYKATVTVSPSENTLSIKLWNNEFENNLTRAAYHTEASGGVGDPENGVTLWVGSIFGIDNIPAKNIQGARLAGADMLLRSGATITAKAFKNNLEVGSTNLGVIEGAQWVYADFTSSNITITGNDEVKVAFIVSDYGKGNYPIAIDSGPCVDGRGNIYSDDGNEWETFDDSNFAIGAYFSFTDAESVDIDNSPLTIFVGDTQEFAYTPNPVGSMAFIDWTSSDDEVAAIDGDKLIGLKAGAANVTGSYKASTASIAVTVVPELEDITTVVDPCSFETVVSWTAKTDRNQWALCYYSMPDGTRRTILTANPEVKLQGLLPESTYHLTIGGVRTYNADEYWGMSEYSFQTGTPAWTEKLTLNLTDTTAYTGCSFRLTATTTPERVYDSELVWSSSDQLVAKVDVDGTVTTIKEGEALISVRTKKGQDETVIAQCAVNVVNGLGDIKTDVGQNDIYLSWEDSVHDGTWRIDYGQKIIYIPQSIETTDKHLHVSYLDVATAYSFTVTAVMADGTDATQRSVELTTLESAGSYSKLCDVKGTYSTDEDVVLRVGNITGKIERIDWTIDGVEAVPPRVRLAAGKHTIIATVTTAGSKVQKLIKHITVK